MRRGGFIRKGGQRIVLMNYRLWPVHRAEYQRVLWEAAKKRGVTLRLGSLVVDIDEEHPAVIIKGGERIEGDLVIGADGELSLDPRRDL